MTISNYKIIIYKTYIFCKKGILGYEHSVFEQQQNVLHDVLHVHHVLPHAQNETWPKLPAIVELRCKSKRADRP